MEQHNLGWDVEYEFLNSGKSVKDNPLPKMDGAIKLEDFTPNGKKVGEIEKPMESFLHGLISSTFGGPDSYFIGQMGQEGHNAGICCGTGSTPNSLSTAGIQTQIQHSDNGLYYMAGQNFSAPVYDNGYFKVSTSRTFHNKSASTINIKEYATSNKLREVVDSPLPAHYTRTVTLTLKFPATTQSAWLLNFWKEAHGSWQGTTHSWIDRAGNTKSYNSSSHAYFNRTHLQAGANNSNYGIIVGTGNADVAWDTDYDLASPITNGTGAGQLVHSACSDDLHFVSAYNSGNSKIVEHWRDFTNSSGSPITVKEAGVAYYHATYFAGGNILMARWLINGGTGITIPDGEVLRIKWKPKITI